MGGKVIISPDLVKTSVKIDANGNEISDFKTKQVVNKAEEPYVPPEVSKQESPQEKPPKNNMAELIDAIAQKRAEDINKQIDQRTVEILKETLK